VFRGTLRTPAAASMAAMAVALPAGSHAEEDPVIFIKFDFH
jgi:hypothetical protein